MTHKLYKPKSKVDATFVVREGSSDIKSVDETWLKKKYQRPSAGFMVLPGENWLDLGANIGAFTVWAGLAGAKVRAYEAQTDNQKMITTNVMKNNLQRKVTLFGMAVVPDSSDGMKLKFYESKNPASFRRHTLYGNYMNARNKKNFVETVVHGIGFSKLLTDGYDCVKMNIEGAEIPIFNELTEKPPIRKLVFEYSFDMDKKIKTYVGVLEKLSKLFDEVIPARKIPLDLEEYPYFPPNNYIFCMNH